MWIFILFAKYEKKQQKGLNFVSFCFFIEISTFRTATSKKDGRPIICHLVHCVEDGKIYILQRENDNRAGVTFVSLSHM